jgi:hypothetical protein
MNQFNRAIRSLGLACAALLLALCSSFAAPALAATTQYNVPQLQTFVEAVDDMEQRQAIDPALANQQREYYAEQASKIDGNPISVEALRKWNRFEGVFRVQALFTIGAVILGMIGAIYFFGELLLRILNLISGFALFILEKILLLLSRIPVPLYELGFCGAGAYLMIAPSLALQLVGAAVFLGSLSIFHGAMRWDQVGKYSDNKYAVVTGITTLAYGACSVLSQSVSLGVLAALAFVSFFGFKVISGPLTLVLGYSEEDLIARGTVASGTLTIFGVILSLGILPSTLTILQGGALIAGGIVYFIGLDILSSKWVAKSNDNYVLMQIVTILSGIGGIWLGASLNLGLLTGVSSTLFGIYLIEKYGEFCSLWVRNKLTFGASLLMTSGLCFGIVKVLEMYPQYFILNTFK